MKRQQGTNKVQLVFTVALKKEVPRDWLASGRAPVYSLAALMSGAMSSGHQGVMVVVSGAGPEASREAALWIRDTLAPLFVVNIGTCGVLDRKYPIGRWIRPRYVCDGASSRLGLDTRLPFPCSEELVDVQSLLSVEKAVLGNIPVRWKQHSVIDMECHAQAKIFSESGSSFHCLKFGTDYSDRNALSDFHRHVVLFSRKMRDLLSFMDTPRDEIKITAAIPVYNRRDSITRAVDSVLSQSFQPAEVVVIDDGSTDGTDEALSGYGRDITRLTLPVNSGVSRARNIAVHHAGTEWIAFLDSDDLWEKDKLKNQVEYLKHYPHYEIVQSEEVWIRDGVRVNPCKYHRKPSGWIWERSLERCLVSPSSVLMKRCLFERYGGFDEGLPVCEDYDLWLRISRFQPVGLEPSLSVLKHGGHHDQLSSRYSAIDRFRVRPLYALLRKELSADYRAKIVPVLEKKLNILLKGYKKRAKTAEARECMSMLDSLACYQATADSV